MLFLGYNTIAKKMAIAQVEEQGKSTFGAMLIS